MQDHADQNSRPDNIPAEAKRRDLIFRVFVSSTFEDMKPERNALQKAVFPALREYCRQRNARFQAVDLRWGVSEEASYDQQAMPICLKELERCQDVSPRPNFIILLGQRYGWVPLPAEIDADEFDLLLGCIPENTEDRARVDQWYRLDHNAAPEAYVLLPRQGEFRDKEAWRAAEGSLRTILQNAAKEALAEDDPRLRKYFESATHQEINHGALHDKLDSGKHVHAYFRTIEGAPSHGSAERFIDTGDAADNLETLRNQIRQRLPEDNIHLTVVQWDEMASEAYLGALCQSVEAAIKATIDAELADYQGQDALHRERDSHREFGLQRCDNFIGRTGVLGRIESYLASDSQSPLVIHGPSGFGKTAVMAQARETLTDADKTIVRFIGATPGSADLRSLLLSLCRELGVDSPPEELNELITAFRNRLSGQDAQPAVLFLDALDQLNDTNAARMLSWLPRELAGGVKLVLSVLDDEGQRECFDAISNWSDAMVPLGPLSSSEGRDILKLWLKDAARTLQDQQRDDVLEKFAENGGPLFLKLAFEQARRWRSWDALPDRSDEAAGISTTVEDLLRDLFDRLEHDHRAPLVSGALKYIAAARSGLTEEELMDLLSRDPIVLKDFIEHSPTERAKPPEEQLDELPLIVWSRLFADIESYMTHRRADGTVVMNFYHRQVGAAVVDNYLKEPPSRLAAHNHLAEYFDSREFWAESLEAQQARAKRLPPTPRPANVRKVVELPHHRLEAAKLGGGDDPTSPYWDAVADLLTNWEFLEAKAEADPDFQEQQSEEPTPASE